MRALEDELPGEHFNMWVRPLQAVESNGALKLLAPNRFAVGLGERPLIVASR